MDKQYFLNLIKTRTPDIKNELVKMNYKNGEINSKMTKYADLNKEFEILSKRIQDLEGELADYNLTGDKYIVNMRAEDMEEVYNRIKLYKNKNWTKAIIYFWIKPKLWNNLMKLNRNLIKFNKKLNKNYLIQTLNKKMKMKLLGKKINIMFFKFINSEKKRLN